MQNAARDERLSSPDRLRVLVRLEGPESVSLHELHADHPLLLIGRSAQSDLRLEDVEISRRHALLVRWDDGVFCVDLGSRGGTRIGDADTQHGWLASDAAVAVGPYRVIAESGLPDGHATLPVLHRDMLPSTRDCDWQLEFLSGAVQPAVYTLRRPLTLIGRKSPCKVQLKLPRIQSVHAAFLVTREGLYLRDLSGRCAVRVDGRDWLGGWLHDGQQVELGDVQLRVLCTVPAGGPRMPDAETDDPVGGATQESLPVIAIPGDSATTTEPPPARSITGMILNGRYQIVKRLARGGMGVVYQGLDVRLHRTVAIKVVRGAGSASQLGRRRLLREAMVGARLDHPHIIRVLDADKEGRYAVFEHVAGETLGDRLRRAGRFGPIDAARWLAQVADAIEHLRGHGIVHRDIKPSNILLAPGGYAKLLDLGLAFISDAGDSQQLALLTEETERPRKGIAIGTAPFASPEQFENSQGVDTRSDIYSAGCTLYSVLAGRPPFYGTVQETYRMHCESPPPPLADVPAALTAIIEKCLAKRPTDRYQTGAELAAELRTFLKSTWNSDAFPN